MVLLRIILILVFFTSLAKPVRTKWLVQRTSTIRIAGSTNVNSFCCHVNEYTGPDTITLTVAGGNLGALAVNIEEFNCNNRIMTGEFKKTLKYKQYPQLKIVFISLEKMPAFGPMAETVKGCVEVELAGMCRKFEVTYTSCRTDDEDVELVGGRVFGFSDFGLTPPRKMGGLVRVNDKLDVQFTLHLHQIN
ncbi:MAG: hypothetical protein J0H74_32965 [Chitinophagaceae bacterium]|nr:hypothetical protein [Chitinophagaceae bacterium]